MERTLSELILEIHSQSKVNAPDEFRKWAVNFCLENFGVTLFVWLESPEHKSINSSHLFISGIENSIADKIKKCIQPEVEQSSSPLNEIDYLPLQTESLLSDLISQVEPSLSAFEESSLTLPYSRIKNTLFLAMGEDKSSSLPLDYLHKIIHHLIEAYDASFLLYFSQLSGSPAIALVDRKGVILHCHYSFSENLYGYQTDTSFDNSTLKTLMHSRFVKFENGYVKLAGLYNELFVLVAVKHNKMSEKLTTKELSISYQYSKGLTYKEVGKIMGISPSTVNKHLNNVYQKLAVGNKHKLLEIFEHG